MLSIGKPQRMRCVIFFLLLPENDLNNFTVSKNRLTVLAAVSLALTGFALQSCDDGDSYGERRERERQTIRSFVSNGTLVKAYESDDTLLYVPPIKTISEAQFEAQDSTTNVAENEYVLFMSSGVYMQIVRKGVGEKIKNGETATVLARYTEVNLQNDTIQTSNENLYSAAIPDIMTVSNTLGTFTASFISGMMYAYYGGYVPSGWLVPFSFVNIGRQDSPGDEIAKVRLIVPSTEGQRDASGNVYACFYEITFQRGYR